MSAVVVFAPAIIAAWPAISAAAAGAAAALGLAVAREVKEATAETPVANRVEVEVGNSQILAETMATGEEMVLTKDNIRVRVFRDERGECRVCVEGEGRTNDELKAFGEQVVQKITQMFVYNRVMSGLKDKGFTVVQEEVTEDDSVHINVRRHVD